MKNLTLTYLFAQTLYLTSPTVQANTCVAIAGQRLDPSSIYDQRHQCATCQGQAAQPKLCRAINRVMVPYWSASADLVAIPHRGLWGMPMNKGPSENTLAAFKAAAKAGYHIIEVDAALTGPDSTGKRKVFLGHYFSMAAVGGSAKKKPGDYAPENIVQFKMRKRDQSLSTDPEDRLILFSELLPWAVENQVLLMVDPKVLDESDARELEQVVAYALNEAKARGALANIAIKATNSYISTLSGIKPFLDAPYSSYEGKFLWSPIPNRFPSITQQETLNSINAWHAATNSSKQVITYELNLFSATSWAAKPFTDGATYLNLIDYIRHLTPLGKRSAIWSIDPMGDKGTFGRTYQWKFIGNSAGDGRGNLFRNLSYALARHVAVNTDRPDWYDNLVINPY